MNTQSRTRRRIGAVLSLVLLVALLLGLGGTATARHWRAAAPVDPSVTTPKAFFGYDIGDDYQVLVLYASEERITLKYTREDNVVGGYTLHMENVCVEPSLLALYQSWNDQGRGYLPALRAGQAFGRARGDEIGVAIRDTGAFQDPRSRKDWWKGR